MIFFCYAFVFGFSRFFFFFFLPSHIVPAARNVLEKVLTQSQFHDKRKVFIQRCVENIGGHKSVYQSMKLLQKIIESLPRHRVFSALDDDEAPVTQYSAILQLETEFGVLGLLFKDLEVFFFFFCVCVLFIYSYAFLASSMMQRSHIKRNTVFTEVRLSLSTLSVCVCMCLVCIFRDTLTWLVKR